MDESESNPKVSPFLRLFYLVVALTLCLGTLLFFRPPALVPRWLWAIPPFNARFLGAIYLSALVSVVLVLIRPRWAPVRPVLAQSFWFVSIVSIYSIGYRDHFDFHRRATWAWFVVYLVPVAILGAYRSRYRSWPSAVPVPISSRWQRYLQAEAGILTAYALALMAAPAAIGRYWPWGLDAFHGRLYSALFVSLGAGSAVLSGAAAPSELVTVGLTRVTLGAAAILGVVLVDARVHRVLWMRPWVWGWMAAFGLLAMIGAAMVALGMMGEPASRLPAPVAAPPRRRGLWLSARMSDEPPRGRAPRSRPPTFRKPE
jgi:hypothetical protein